MLATLALCAGIAAPPPQAALQAGSPHGDKVSLKAAADASMPKKECSSLSDLVTDEWCVTSCNAKVKNCPEDMCMCYDPGEATGQGSQAFGQQAAFGVPIPEEPQCEGTMCIDPDSSGGQMTNGTDAEAPTCNEMQSITADQLQCVFPMLGIENAQLYASSASDRIGPLLGTSCAWAAFLGNVAIESKELTKWTEIQCKTSPPYCGRGPLQLTSKHNYNFCADLEICDCPDIAKEYEQISRDPDLGFGTAACVWGAMFGYSLSELADGTRDGMLKTCCTIHQGHFPCEKMSQYARRVEYWETATMCLGTGAKAASAQVAMRKARSEARANETGMESPRPEDWGRPRPN
jgi:hypothetical protein